MSVLRAVALALAIFAWPALAHDAGHHHAQQEARLPTIGPAPDFALTSQDGKVVRLSDFQGKVVALAFIYTSCDDVCPMLTANMAQVQEELGADFGSKVVFVSVTTDPERDTPDVLKEYAEAYAAKPEGWTFLTGDPPTVHDVGKRYGIFAEKKANGDVDHILLTSLIDPKGVIRVQYLGYRFDLGEFRRDLLSLMGEAE